MERATKLLVVGAGSIGNHLSHAARAVGWDVTVCDSDPAALERMKNDIYPTRYGSWDTAIALVESKGELPEGEFDVIAIGTPPDSHMKLALAALEKEPKLLHVEKPLFTPLDDIEAFKKALQAHPNVMVTVGYDHAVAPSVRKAFSIISDGVLGDVQAIQSHTLEHWAGIFGAHPWLAGPHDSYLGYWHRGGGALNEHSHALHLGISIANAAGWGALNLQHASQNIVKGEQGEEYDQLTKAVLVTDNNERNLTVVQDVITQPTEKAFRVIGEHGVLDVALSGDLDTVTLHAAADEPEIHEFKKSRPDDFLALMLHYEELLADNTRYARSPIHIDTGLDTMAIIQATFKKRS